MVSAIKESCMVLRVGKRSWSQGGKLKFKGRIKVYQATRRERSFSDKGPSVNVQCRTERAW